MPRRAPSDRAEAAEGSAAFPAGRERIPMLDRWKLGTRARVADALALGAGLVLPLAFAPFDLYPLAVLALAVLFALWLGVRPARAAWRGWLFGLGQFGFGVWWIHESFRFSDVSPPLAVFLTAVLVAALALYPALAGYAATRFFSGGDLRGSLALRRTHLLLVFPAAWMLVEWLRGVLFTGFTWLQVGYSQIAGPLAGIAPVLGVYGVGWLVALSAAALVLAFYEPGRWRAGAFVALLAVWTLTGALRTVDWTVPAGPPMRVALVQGNVPQSIKWLPDERAPTLERYLEFTREHWNAELIIWPETALPGLYREFTPLTTRLAQQAQRHHTEIFLGAPVERGDPARYYNAVAFLGPERGFYFKRHLVPFGEYVPFRHLLGGLLNLLQVPMSNFSAGPARQPLPDVFGQKVGISICYEAAFGGQIRASLPAARLLVNVSNDAWFGNSIGPHQNLEMARMRALETGRYLARATNTGITAIIGPHGDIRQRLPQFVAAALSGTVTPLRGSTPYVRVGDWPVLLLLGLTLAAALWGTRGRRAG